MKVHVLHVPNVDSQRDEIVTRLGLPENVDLCVHEDPERNGCMSTWLDCLQCAARHDTDKQDWSVIVSDDADPLTNWVSHMRRACANSPQPFLGLTHFGGYGQQALAKGVPYGMGPHLVWGGAIGYHRSYLRQLNEWAHMVVDQTDFPHDDWLVMAFARKVRVQTAMTARAIFGQPVKKSLLGHNTPVREPATTIENIWGPDYSARPHYARISRTVPVDRLMDLLAVQPPTATTRRGI